MAVPKENKENTTTTIPRNWKTMFGNKNEQDINNMFLTIVAWSPPRIKVITTDLTNIYDYTASKRIEGFRFFYPRDNIQEQIKHVYSETSSTVTEAITGFRGGVTKNLAAVTEASTGATGGALTEEPHIFNKSERRTFSINIPLIAYDDLDKDIYEALRFFRKNSYPRRRRDSKGTPLLNIIEYPSVFKIRGGLFETNQPAIGSTFVLEDCTIDYAANTKKFIEGLPIEATLTLGFTELNILFGEDFDATPINVNVTQSSKRGELGATLKASKNARESVEDTGYSKSSPVGAKEVKGSKITDVSKYIKKSRLARSITSLPETDLLLEAEAMVKSSNLYKKVTGLVDIDPTHLAEVKKVLGKIRGL